MKLSTTLQQSLEKSRSTIQVLQEALNSNSSELAGLKLEALDMSRELEEVETEKERVKAELKHIMADNSESTSRMAGILKFVEGFFVHRRDE